MKNDLIISLAVKGRDNYEANLPALEVSIEKYWNGDKRILRHFPDDVRPHSYIPYAFKFDLIEQARNDGYTKIIWADSTIRLYRDVSHLLPASKTGVILFHNLGHDLYHWISDEAVSNLIKDEKLESERDIYSIPNVWGGIFLLDLNKIVAQCFFEAICTQIELGSFNNGSSTREGFIAHRFDQSIMAVLGAFYKVDVLPYGIIAAPKDITEDTCFLYGDKTF